ncbi:MAG: hypothetical protein E2598_07605 [Sphingobium sp.]|nr:hypothetical protein [Sphingobium sp.]
MDCQFQPADRVLAWAEKAAKGETLAYARAYDRAPDDALVMPRSLSDAGLVELVRRRRDGHWAYIAQRTAMPFDPARINRRASRGCVRLAGRGSAQAMDRALMRILGRCVRLEQPCPSNAALAVMLGLTGEIAASYRMRRLVAQGLIEVEQPDPRAGRIITILSSGARTAPGTLAVRSKGDSA